MTAPSSFSAAVTVVATRRVRSGCEAAYEAWLAGLIREASSMPGYLGADVIRPETGGARVYTSIFRFDSVANLGNFEGSELRRRALAEVVDLVEADAIWERLSGLELWFTPPPGLVVPQPSRARMALLLIVVVYALVLSIGQVVTAVIGDAPTAVRLLVTIVVEVTLLTYVVMPRITRWLARWIYPRKQTP